MLTLTYGHWILYINNKLNFKFQFIGPFPNNSKIVHYDEEISERVVEILKVVSCNFVVIALVCEEKHKKKCQVSFQVLVLDPF